jgi:hypothetical protein
VARCVQEQEEILGRANISEMPAWLVILGLEDWECEKRLIEAGR